MWIVDLIALFLLILLLNNHLGSLHVQLLKEFLIGSTFTRVRQHASDIRLLRILPLTTIISYHEEQMVCLVVCPLTPFTVLSRHYLLSLCPQAETSSNEFSQACLINYSYERMSAEDIKEGTEGKVGS